MTAHTAPARLARATRVRVLTMWLLLVLAALSSTAQAADDFLPVEQAFAPTAARTANGDIAVTWQIADSYYLYRHAFDFSLRSAGGATLDAPRIPDGEKHNDEFFGEVET